ncbi:MAG: sulfatase-like hydrolase/transferase [Verrucomicrobiota bacterium]
MFLIDDQDFEELSPYGGETYTPNLERMAAEGIKFNKAYVSSTVCTPSRYTFLTGRYAGAAYDKSYLNECPPGQQGHVAFNMGLEEDNMNVGAVLAANGYATGFVGKYHVHGTEGTSEDELKYGIKPVKTEKHSPEVSDVFKANELVYRKLIMKRGFTWAKHIYWGNMNKPYSSHNPEWTMQAALEFIETQTQKKKPFYLHYCSTLLHGPNGEWYKSMTEPENTGQGYVEPDPEVVQARQNLLQLLQEKGLDPKTHFGRAWIDANLGVLLDKLQALGIDNNTLVVFAPDHGSSDKGCVYAHNGSHIPLLMRWPAGISAGLECNELVQNIDMVPTFFDLAQAEVPSDYKIHGISLSPLFKDGKAPQNEWRDHLYFEIGSARAIMTHEWKYIASRHTQERIQTIKKVSLQKLPKAISPLNRPGIGFRGADHPGFWKEDQLYNMSKDPKEMDNLAASAEYKPKKKEMQKKLTEVLQIFERPYGEFIPGGNAAEPGQVDEQIDLVQKLKIKGKKVIIPPELENL